MPTGPKGQRRPADAIGNAIRVAQIATGEAEEELEAKSEKNEAAELLMLIVQCLRGQGQAMC